MLVLPPAAMGELALPNNQITSADKNTVCFNPALDIIALARPGLGQLTNAQLHALMQTQWQKLSSQQVRYNEHAS